jgi:CRISPR system Cascade subunit CasC
MFIELHVIQNFAPSNLNRSETGTPKECEFGGHRRARISSQCFKRAMRDLFDKGELFKPEQKKLLADRSKLFLGEMTKQLVAQGKSPEESFQVAAVAFNACKLKFDGENQSSYLVFAGKSEIQAINDWCLQNWDELVGIAAHPDYQAVWQKHNEIRLLGETPAQAEQESEDLKKKAKKLEEELQKLETKAIEGKKFSKEQKKLLKSAIDLLSGGKAADLALFGRMLADLPKKNIVAASQVAHAISTHKCGVEFDFYTAVDDLQSEEKTGAGMMGTVEFNSACFYRYANIDLRQLKENLGDDETLTAATVEAFLRAAINAIPAGKQNSMAAQNPPLFVLAVVRKAGLWSLANAFVDPATPREGDLVSNSIKKLDEHWGQLTTMYGAEQIADKCYVSFNGQDLPRLNGARVASISELVGRVLNAVKGA